jgi:uncharacterized repeat protein (TIGR01451 family)
LSLDLREETKQMKNPGADSKLFEEFTSQLLNCGAGMRFRARGASMSPAIRDGEIVQITHVIVSKLRKDDIVLTKSKYGFRLHRIVYADHANDFFITRGDCGQQDDPPLCGSQILGLARAKEVRVGRINVQAQFRGIIGWLLRCAARGQHVFINRISRVESTSMIARVFAIACILLLAAGVVDAQVALDSTSSSSATFTATGANSFNFNHVTTTTANRVLVVGVSLNITRVPTAKVTGITYGGTALTSLGSQNDSANTQRVEMWYLLAPASGTASVVVTVNLPTAGTVGVVAGASTFTDVDQTVPLGSFVSSSGAAAGYSQLNVPSVVNGMVLDTLSINGNETITVSTPQTAEWNLTSAANATGVTGSGSIWAGAPSLPFSETFSANSNWSIGAISINPSTADIAVTTSVNDVEFGQNSTYTITVTNNGPSAANNVTLTDTFADTNLSLVSYTPSAGTTCTLSTTINCTLPTPLASGATATLAVTVSTSAAGYYPNTAKISDSGTPPDPNTGNNSYVAVAPVLDVVCSATAPGAGGTLGGVINTYYPGSATVAAGATSIPVGTKNGAGTIAKGSELLVIQMQNATISTSNTVAYGNGYTGAGFTAVNGAGNYEYVIATGPVAAGSVPIQGAGANAGLVFSYTASAATSTQGVSTYQVVLVPQYSSATLSSTLTAAPWNGATGGILALDLSGALTLNGATVSVNGLGFRGGAGLSLEGENGAADTDYEFAAPATYTTPAPPALANTVGADGSKGEGIAGTPLWVQNGTVVLNTGSGYPSGTAGADGSMGRGAPGTAGGGATDGAPSVAGENNDNAGGGGGGNGGAGGFGGNTYGNNLSTGGEGGVAFPSTVDRLTMGGGGGGGSNNYYQEPEDSSGGNGGGIIFIRAGSLSGTATLTANGAAAYTGTSSNAGGGGGAGGTIVVVTATGGETGLTLQANGGTGGGNQGCTACGTQTFLEGRIGPGAGGGGGAVFTSSVSGVPTISVAGGANGFTMDTTATPVPYGATSGALGTSMTTATPTQVTGIQSSAVCSHGDLAITKTHGGGNLTLGTTATYTLGISNVSPLGTITGTTTVTDTIPTGLTPTAAAGTGWTCTISGQLVTCTRSGNLAPGASYPNITINVSVLQTAPSTVVNTATVSNAGDLDPLNNTATDTATVVASSDMAIVKTGAPNPVAQGAALTYTLTVTNNGPSNATNVTVTDTLPSGVTYGSYTTTQGSCTYTSATATLTCSLGAMNSGATATITIATTPQTPEVVSNTATVTATQPDPNSANNSSTQSETITYPTAVALESFAAGIGTDKTGARHVVLTWKTGGEARNLGFNVYHELNGNRVRVNSSLIAGSALLMNGALPRHASKSYAWIDSSPATAGAIYWLEDVDVNGIRTMHGPISVATGISGADESVVAETRTFSQLSRLQLSGVQQSRIVESVAAPSATTNAQMQRQFALAASPAVKIFVQHEGWYRITQPQLIQAGLDPNVDPSTLHLYAEAMEQPMQITRATPGAGGFGPQAAINFYGTGIDTVFSGTRVYWLVGGEGKGARVPLLPMSEGSNQPPASFSTAVELRQHTTYFAALLTQDGQNFFGSLVSTTPIEQTINVPHVATNSTQNAYFEISLQGIITGFPHDVSIALNGSNIGDVVFTGQEKGHFSGWLPSGLLQQGVNTITLTAQNGDYDTSLVDFIRITYPHTYVADSDQLKFTARAGEQIFLSGFTAQPTVLDITDPEQPVQLTPRVISNSGNYSAAMQIPWTTTNTANLALHTLLAVGSDRVRSPVALRANRPSHWHSAQNGADIAMITYDGFAVALDPLVRAHEQEGKSSAVVPVSALYDEFNFGEHSPYAIREFLQSATQNWTQPPRYLLLNGRASFDPRNYLGFGQLDLVPTDIFPSSALMTASDDWFSDFSNIGMPTIATGRIPATTLDEDTTAIQKIAGYEEHLQSGAWISSVLMVADRDDAESFTQDSNTVQAQLPATVQPSEIFVGTLGTTTAQQELINGINSGQVLVNYLGHGSEEQWSGSDIFDNNSVAALTNQSQLPVFLIMDCLNGFFQDVYAQSLGVTLLLAPNGGAVAVLASSGLNQAPPQTHLDQLVVENAFKKNATLGDSILKAKSQINDADVRRTFNLLGDPAMQIKQPAANSR